MSVSESNSPNVENQAQELKGLSKAIKSLDGAILRFDKAVQEMQCAVSVLSGALQEITACTAKLRFQNGVDEFNALCTSIGNCVESVQQDQAVTPPEGNDTYDAVHKDLEALRGRTELLAACEKSWRRTRDKCSKYASSSHTKKQQQYVIRLGDMTTQLRALQRTYEYELPNTLSGVLHRVLKGSSQFCRSLGTTLLCCGNESRRYSENLRRPSATSETTAVPPPLTDEQQKGLALQHFARDFFFSAPLASRTFGSLSAFCDDQGTPVDKNEGVSGLDPGSSGCSASQRGRQKSGESFLWSPVDPPSPLSQLHIVPQDMSSMLDRTERARGMASQDPFAALRQYPWQTPESTALERDDEKNMSPARARTVASRARSAPPLRRATRHTSVSPVLGRSLATVGALLQLEQDNDCPF